MQDEFWKDIMGYESIYQVSNLGKVKSLDRLLINKNNRKYILKGAFLKSSYDKRGYLIYQLSKNNIKKTLKLHRILGKTFIENPNNLSEINHIDGNKNNNSLNNLEWCTTQHNISEAFNMGLMKRSKVAKTKDGIIIKTYDSITNAAFDNKIAKSSIHRCLNKNCKQIKGFQWQYI
jgi:hypothetical protein